jgi:Flp pilus assembly protein TadD
MSTKYGVAAFAAFALLGIANAPAAFAETSAPGFAVQKAADAGIRAGYQAYARGDYKIAATITQKATAKGMKKSRRSIAYSNLCAALGQQGALVEAGEACDTALTLAPKNWQARNNLGVVHYLAGDKEMASADFAAAAKFPKAELAQANADLLASTKMAASE